MKLNFSNFFIATLLLKVNVVKVEKICTQADNILGMSCGVRALDFASKIKNLDVNNADEMKEIIETCDALNYCTENLGHCPTFQEEEIKNQFRNINVYCDVINFVTQQFSNCERVLDEREIQCYKNWDPFKLLDDLKDEEKVQDVCGKFFGDGQCLKSEVSDNCGEGDWEKLKDKMLSLSDNVKECDFNGDI